MTLSPAQVARFDVSLARCLAEPAFLNSFYERLIKTSPDVAAMFQGTDFLRQRRATAASLYLLVLALEQGEGAIEYLDRIARQHSRAELDVRPEMYDAWCDCLLQCASEFDPMFSDDIEQAWRGAADFAIEFMRARY